MAKKIFFPVLLILLIWVFFLSPTSIEIAAGVAILLFGMIMLEDGFKAFVEGPLQKFLHKATDKLYKSLLLGFAVTALLQSSSLITVVTIAFISAGIIGLKQGIGIIFGANLGSTATAWLVSIFGLNINISNFAMPMLAFGIIFFFQKSKVFKGLGNVLGGLGFFFLGIYYMKLGFDNYRETIHLAEYAIPGFWGIILFTFIGLVITVILQSSSAAMAVILTALAAGQIPYNNALALAIGANVGTTITAVLGAIGVSMNGRRLAAAHFIFNMITGMVALILIIPLSGLVDWFTELIGFRNDNYTFKLALFHSIFNLTGVLIMVPAINYLIRFLEKTFKEEEEFDTALAAPIFLNESILAFPQTAIRALLDESKELFEKATLEIVAHGLNLHREDISSKENLKQIIKSSKEKIDVNIEELYYKKVKTIYNEIIKYATLAQSKFSLSAKNMEVFTRIKIANRNIVEAIKEIQGLRKNVQQYMDDDNEYISKEYDKLRYKVSRVLREIHFTRKDSSPAAHLSRLEALKEKAMKSDALIDGTLDNLIRNNKITSTMATSLANDSNSIASISKKLIETAELLYIQSDTLIELE